MGAKKGHLFGHGRGNVNQSGLTGDVEGVPGLYLDSRNAPSPQRAEAPEGGPGEFLGGSGSGRRHGAANTATVVPQAGHSSLKLVTALTGEDEVGVRINKSGYHRATLHVEDLVTGRGRARRAHPGDEAVIENEGGVVQSPDQGAVAP